MNGVLEETVRFAIAAASLKVTRSGLEDVPCAGDTGTWQRRLRVEHMIYRDNQFFEIEKLLKLPPNNPLVRGSPKTCGTNYAQRRKQMRWFKRKMFKV